MEKEELKKVDAQYIEVIIFNLINSYKTIFGKDFIDNILNKKFNDTYKMIQEAQYISISCIHDENKGNENMYEVNKASALLSQAQILLKINEDIEVCETLKPLNKKLDEKEKEAINEYNNFLLKNDTKNMSEEESNEFNSLLYLKSNEYSNMVTSCKNCKNIDNIIYMLKESKNRTENNMEILSGLKERRSAMQKIGNF